MERNQNPPSSGPRGTRGLAPLAVGTYADIIAVYGPANAAYGDQVSISVVVMNLASYPIYIGVGGHYDTTGMNYSPEYAAVDAGGSYVFTASFSMPNKSITLDVWSWYWTGAEWVVDDHEAISIPLRTLAPEFRRFGVTQYNKV